MDILSVGLMVCDVIMRPVDASIFQQDSVRLDSLKIAPGGDALNAAIQAARMGNAVGLIGRVGNDALGDMLIREAEANGVEASGVVRDAEHATSTSIVMVDGTGERHFAYYGKPNDLFSLADIGDDALRGCRVLHVGSAMALDGLDGEGLHALFSHARRMGVVTSLDVTWDSTGQWLSKIDRALHETDVFMPSLDEAKRLSGQGTAEECAAFFQQYGIGKLVIKLGDQGCYVADAHRAERIEACSGVPVVDTTGAGDAFVGAFLSGLCRGYSLEQCAALGNVVAARCVTMEGATSCRTDFDAAIALVKQHHAERASRGAWRW